MSGDTLPLHVETVGSGPPIVLLHGFAANRFTWRKWVPTLARRHEVFLVDLKGCGDAPKPPDGRYGPHDQADLVHRLLRERDLRDVTLVGHSLGGGLALLVALRLLDAGELDRLARLVLIAAPTYAQSLPRYVGFAHRLPELVGRVAARVIPPTRLARAILRQIVYEPDAVTADQVEGYAAPYRDAACRRAVVDSARTILPVDLDRIVARYPEIRRPTLLLWGREDRVVPPRVAERLARDLPDARLVLLDRCGHVPMEERPEEGLEALVRFLEGT